MEVVHQTRDLFLLWGWVKTYYYHILGEELSINQLYFRVPSGHQGFDPQPCGLHRPCCFSPWCRNSPHLAPPPSPRAWVRLSAARPWWVSSLVAGKSRNPGFFMVNLPPPGFPWFFHLNGWPYLLEIRYPQIARLNLLGTVVKFSQNCLWLHVHCKRGKVAHFSRWL